MTNQPITPYNFGKKLEEPKGPPPPDFDNVPENKALWDNLRREYKAYQEALRIYNIQKGEKPNIADIKYHNSNLPFEESFIQEKHDQDLNIWYAGQNIYEGFDYGERDGYPYWTSGDFEVWFHNGEIILSMSDSSYGIRQPTITHEQFQTVCKWWGVELKKKINCK